MNLTAPHCATAALLLLASLHGTGAPAEDSSFSVAMSTIGPTVPYIVGRGAGAQILDVGFTNVGDVADTLLTYPAWTFRCAVHATLDGKPRKKIVVKTDSVVETANGVPVCSFDGTLRTKKNGWASKSWSCDGNVAATEAVFRTVATPSGNKMVDHLSIFCSAGSPSPCVPSSEQACLLKDQFGVSGFFTDPFDGSIRPLLVNQTGAGSATLRFAPLSETIDVSIENHCDDPNIAAHRISVDDILNPPDSQVFLPVSDGTNIVLTLSRETEGPLIRDVPTSCP